VKYSIVEKRWEGHEKNIKKSLSFRPAYARLIKRLSEEKGISQREVIEKALKELYGDPKKESGEVPEK
jgi:hypothetical protein